jgi:hypothetical protein
VAFSLSSWRFLHDKNDEKDCHGAEDWSSTQGPVPIPGKGRREAASDNISEAAEKKVFHFISYNRIFFEINELKFFFFFLLQKISNIKSVQK